MNRYLLSIYQPDGPAPPPEVLGQVMHRVGAWERELKAAGAWVFTAGLQPAGSAAVVRPEGDGVLVTDGPYAEGKEHLGGFVIIKVPDLDAALGWARKQAEAVRMLPIEVRPFQGEAED